VAMMKSIARFSSSDGLLEKPSVRFASVR
jgi:hypothetical protein